MTVKDAELEEMAEMLFTELDKMIDHDGAWDSIDQAKKIILGALACASEATREDVERRTRKETAEKCIEVCCWKCEGVIEKEFLKEESNAKP